MSVGWWEGISELFSQIKSRFRQYQRKRKPEPCCAGTTGFFFFGAVGTTGVHVGAAGGTHSDAAVSFDDHDKMRIR
jgi:hypothetical protein